MTEWYSNRFPGPATTETIVTSAVPKGNFAFISRLTFANNFSISASVVAKSADEVMAAKIATAIRVIDIEITILYFPILSFSVEQ